MGQSRAHGHMLTTLLICPIQRPPRYEMLLREIFKNTEANHPDYENLIKALTDVSDINIYINKKMKNFTERAIVSKIANKIIGGDKLIQPSRKFIRNGYLIKLGRKRPEKYLFFLFNDLLMYCKPVAINKANNKKDSNSNDIEGIFCTLNYIKNV